MFKVGDVVKRIAPACTIVDETVYNGKMYIVREYNAESNFIWLEGFKYPFDRNFFELVINPIKEAKVTLEKAGYTITPPRELMKGQVAIYTYNGVILTCRKSTYDGWNNEWKKKFPIVAIVDWTEGQGLNETSGDSETSEASS